MALVSLAAFKIILWSNGFKQGILITLAERPFFLSLSAIAKTSSMILLTLTKVK